MNVRFEVPRRLFPITLGLLSLCVSGCLLAVATPTPATIGEDLQGAALDAALHEQIAAQRLSDDPTAGRTIPSIESPIAQLGKQLFFSQSLSGAQDTACASCHLPTLGGGDALALSIGVEADDPDLVGPGRTHAKGAPIVPRNAPTTFNIALWDKVLFHDGRVESIGKTPGANGNDGRGIRTPDVPVGMADPHAGRDLAIAQSRFPVTAEAEMLGFETLPADHSTADVRAYLVARLTGNAEPTAYVDSADRFAISEYWLQQFSKAYATKDDETGSLVSEARIAEALGAYECSQLFIETPWKAYVAGDNDALSEGAKRGALLFLTPQEAGGAGCGRCHQGDFFTSEEFYNLAMPQIGPGKGDGPDGSMDYGRYRETRVWTDLYAFRTPSLLNVAVTGPYGHDGAYADVDAMVRHMLNPAQGVEIYDLLQQHPLIQTEHTQRNTQLALLTLQVQQSAGRETVHPVALMERQILDLLLFLDSLTDPCVLDAVCLAPWFPDDSADPHGLQYKLSAP
jgi:cytochrome c peroxidase